MEETNGPRIVISLSVMTGVSLVLMLLRFFCKARYGKRFGWDDHLLSASWLCLVTYSVLTIVAVNYGIGRRKALIPPGSLVVALELLYIGRFFGIIALAISKSSFAVTLLHLARGPWQRAVIWTILVSLNLVMWTCGFSLFFQCTPVQKAWNLDAPGSCWDSRVQVNIGIGAGAYSAAMDFILAIFPTVLIWHLQMGTREKVGVVVAMSLGVFAGITAIVKSYFITGTARSSDFTFSSADLLIWSASETAVTIMAASIPFLRLIAKEVSGKTQQRSAARHTKNLTAATATATARPKPSESDGYDSEKDSLDGVLKEEHRATIRIAYRTGPDTNTSTMPMPMARYPNVI
ncbi:hypothetical protein B0T24DRAFT_527533 [Lasiosphaeria ovina]|uniref:Rhodopsin domain-containing protein n=1 Tax=Lasiosphaeria ovina TaxID=92902 RepID=A0AAE0KAE4_9PEZI|nr:hypothetical protein B0T24DRAFT_527533 [Lasiosphaeria ovina]